MLSLDMCRPVMIKYSPLKSKTGESSKVSSSVFSLASLAPLQVWYGRRAHKLLAVWPAKQPVRVKLQPESCQYFIPGICLFHFRVKPAQEKDCCV